MYFLKKCVKCYTFHMASGVELIARALVIRDRKILVCQTQGRPYYFLPGGHVEFSETLYQALRREIFEEMGAVVTKAQFIGGVENIFNQNGQLKHEISFVFHAEIDLPEILSKENHVTFHWFSWQDFIEKNFVPPALKDAIIEWTAEKEPFFIEERNNR